MLRLSAGLNTLNGVTIQILQTCFNYNISSSAIVYSKKLKLTFFAPARCNVNVTGQKICIRWLMPQSAQTTKAKVAALRRW